MRSVACVAPVILFCLALLWSPVFSGAQHRPLLDAFVAGASIKPNSNDVKKNTRGAPITPSKGLQIDVELVLLDVTVTDPYDRSITGLNLDNFRVFEDKVEQEIITFSSQDVPISIGMIFDCSGSMSNKIWKSRQAAVEFFKVANPQDEFFLVTFNERAELSSVFTNNVGDLQSQLLVRPAKGRTALLDAIYLGLSQMKLAHNPRRALLILTDGGDNHSRYHEGDIKRLAKEAGTQLYAMGNFDPLLYRAHTPEELKGPTLLGDITDITGGRLFYIDDPNELPETAARISMELRDQYVLGYRPSNRAHDARWRKIKVKMRPPRGFPPLKVYSKTGYYAPSH